MITTKKPIPRALSSKLPLLGLFSILSSLGCQPMSSAESISQSACEQDGNFIRVKAGEYILGSDRQERDFAYTISAEAAGTLPEEITKAEADLRRKGWFDREPPRSVQSQPAVCMGKNLITNAEYQAFVMATGHRSPDISESEYQQQGFLVHPYTTVEPYRWQGQSFPQGEGQHPVVLVSYDDAQAFAQWKGAQDGQVYRLPTAIEWEQAARGTNGSYFPWGDHWQEDVTNWAQHGGLHTSKVATYPLSRSIDGVEDMAGNVFEYTSTITRRRGEQVSVMKGCSWDDSPGFCRAAYQHSRPLDSRHILFGFRLIKEKQ